MLQGIKFQMNIVKMCQCKKLSYFSISLTHFPFERKFLIDAHKVAHGASKGACAEEGQGEEMLLMVQNPPYDSNDTVLRSIYELQPGSTVNHAIPFREGCVCTLFQGEPAKSCLCSNLLFLNT